MIVENVLMETGSILTELKFEVQSHMTMPTLKHVLICLLELRQVLSQLTNVPSHIKKTTNFWEYTTDTNHYHDRHCYYQNTMVNI